MYSPDGNGCGPEPAISDTNVPISPPEWKEIEQFVTGMRGVPDDYAYSLQMSTVVRMFYWLGWELGTSDALGGVHHHLQGFSFRHRDTFCQDALSGAAIYAY